MVKKMSALFFTVKEFYKVAAYEVEKVNQNTKILKAREG